MCYELTYTKDIDYEEGTDEHIAEGNNLDDLKAKGIEEAIKLNPDAEDAYLWVYMKTKSPPWRYHLIIPGEGCFAITRKPKGSD
jgi:hypothetical protein